MTTLKDLVTDLLDKHCQVVSEWIESNGNDELYEEKNQQIIEEFIKTIKNRLIGE